MDTMTSLRDELENAQNRYSNLLNSGRKGQIAEIVLDRVQKEIQNIERRLANETRSRNEGSACPGADRATQNLKQAICGYWLKCDTNYSAISEIPTQSTL
jgi:hypothetical protein